MNRFVKIGKIKPKSSNEIESSIFGIGFEKLDRKVFEPNCAYDKIALLGVKHARVQSGWMRTENERGVYNFEWLDDIINNLLSRGIKPWLSLSYGNPLYTPKAKEVFGGVGCPPIKTEKEKQAWVNYCTALAEHYKGRVIEFEIWNEPDGDHCWKFGASGSEYGELTVLSAKAIKSVIPDARIIGGALGSRECIGWLYDAFSQGMADYLYAISYHDYCEKETRSTEFNRVLRAIVDEFNPNIKLIQGETGCPSFSEGFGALCYGKWTEKKQAKLLLRRVITEVKNGVDKISWFTAVDMIEALNGVVGDKKSYLDYGYFGVLGAEFDEDGNSVGNYRFKPSFYAYQNLISALSDATLTNLPIVFHWSEYSMRPNQMTEEYNGLLTASFKRDNGSKAFIYWKPTNVLTTEFESICSVILPPFFKDIKLVDLLTGEVFTLPDKIIETYPDKSIKINTLPVFDHPLMLTFGDFVEIEN